MSKNKTLKDFSAFYTRESSWKYFPSANLTYSILPGLNYRASYAKSTIRPDLREMAYFREYDFELGGEYKAELLRSTMIDNFDMKLEWFPGAGEVISASAFIKKIKYPMEISKAVSNNIFTLLNNDAARTDGLEFEARKSLGFIPIPVVKNLTLYGNATILRTKVIPVTGSIYRIEGDKVIPELTYGPEEKRPLTGQSNYMTNAGVYYDDRLLHLALSYNKISNRVSVFESDAVNSQYERPLESLDGQVAFNLLHKRAEIRLNVSNLLNSSSIIYRNEPADAEEGHHVQAGDYNTKYLLYQPGQDQIIQQLKPGRTFGISLTYTIK